MATKNERQPGAPSDSGQENELSPAPLVRLPRRAWESGAVARPAPEQAPRPRHDDDLLAAVRRLVTARPALSLTLAVMALALGGVWLLALPLSIAGPVIAVSAALAVAVGFWLAATDFAPRPRATAAKAPAAGRDRPLDSGYS